MGVSRAAAEEGERERQDIEREGLGGGGRERERKRKRKIGRAKKSEIATLGRVESARAAPCQ